MEKININTNESFASEIIINKNEKDNIEKYFENKKPFLITNTKIAKLYPQIINKFPKNNVVIIKDGEKYKNIKTYNFIIEKLLQQKIERKDIIFALGGGVVGDLGAFVASSILRGIDLIQIPTTLLAMCDSSIGGKTGFNTKFGKNLVGSFYPAKKIIIDSSFLDTLNEYEFKCGMGEIVKYAFIEKSCKMNENFNLLEILENISKENIKKEIENIIKICAKLKANVVELDIKEGNLRKILNFGHTFAHPIETLTNYKKISHGEAVSYGIRYASLLAYKTNKIDQSYFNKIISILDKFELANKTLKLNKTKFVNLMKQDKKVINSKINLLLPIDFQSVELFDNIEEPLLEACLP